MTPQAFRGRCGSIGPPAQPPLPARRARSATASAAHPPDCLPNDDAIRQEEAREHLTTATTMYHDMDMRFWLDEAEAELRGESA